MAKNIEIGLELEGQDAIDFYEYLETSTNTPPSQTTVDCVKLAKMLRNQIK